MRLKKPVVSSCLGYDTRPSLQTSLLGTNYYFHNPTDQLQLRGEIMSRIHENVRNIINNTEQRNFRRNLHRKEKNLLRQANEFC